MLRLQKRLLASLIGITLAGTAAAEPPRDFIYRVVGQSVALIDVAPDSRPGDCYRVDATIQNYGERHYAFALVDIAGEDEYTWLAAGDACGERSAPIADGTTRPLPIDEPRPGFVFQTIGASLTQIIDTEPLGQNRFRVTADVADTQLCVLVLESESGPPATWSVGGVECLLHDEPSDSIETEGALKLD